MNSKRGVLYGQSTLEYEHPKKPETRVRKAAILSGHKNLTEYVVSVINEKPTAVSPKTMNNELGYTMGKSHLMSIEKLEDGMITYLKSHWSKFGAFSCSLSSFRRALLRTSIQLPKGRSAHALRHTFASHFVMNGGSILTLQKILGHSTVVMTMRYAHLSPDNLQDAIKLNPLKSFEIVQC